MNYFDKFDEGASSDKKNYFDKFDKVALRNTIEGEDIAKSAGRGLSNAAASILGGHGDMRSALERIGEYVAPGYGKAIATGLDPTTPFTMGMMRGPSSREVRQAATAALPEAAGEIINYDPQTRLGGYARTAGEYAPALAMPAKSLAGRVANTFIPAAASEAAGQATEGKAIEPYARVAAGAAAAFLPGMAQRAFTPLPASPERTAAVRALEKEGVTALTAGQKTGSPTLRYMESVLGDAPFSGGKASKAQAQAMEQFTGAAMGRMGARGKMATPEVMAAEMGSREAGIVGRIPGEFERLSAQNTLLFDKKFGPDMMKSIRLYMKVPPSQQRAVVEGYVQDIADHLRTGSMPGAYYQEMRSRLTKQAHELRNSDSTLANTLRGMRDALDKNMARSIRPEDAAAWAKARREYGNAKTLQQVASRAGEATAEGNIVPTNLRNAIGRDNAAYSTGQGDFNELARAGALTMTPLPQSGTAPRMLAQGIAGSLGGALGTVGTGGNPMGALAGAAAGAAAPGIAGRALMSKLVQKYLGNQRFAKREPMSEAMRRALIQQMLLSSATRP